MLELRAADTEPDVMKKDDGDSLEVLVEIDQGTHPNHEALQPELPDAQEPLGVSSSIVDSFPSPSQPEQRSTPEQAPYAPRQLSFFRKWFELRNALKQSELDNALRITRDFLDKQPVFERSYRFVVAIATLIYPTYSPQTSLRGLTRSTIVWPLEPKGRLKSWLRQSASLASVLTHRWSISGERFHQKLRDFWLDQVHRPRLVISPDPIPMPEKQQLPINDPIPGGERVHVVDYKERNNKPIDPELATRPGESVSLYEVTNPPDVEQARIGLSLIFELLRAMIFTRSLVPQQSGSDKSRSPLQPGEVSVPLSTKENYTLIIDKGPPNLPDSSDGTAMKATHTRRQKFIIPYKVLFDFPAFCQTLEEQGAVLYMMGTDDDVYRQLLPILRIPISQRTPEEQHKRDALVAKLSPTVPLERLRRTDYQSVGKSQQMRGDMTDLTQADLTFALVGGFQGLRNAARNPRFGGWKTIGLGFGRIGSSLMVLESSPHPDADGSHRVQEMGNVIKSALQRLYSYQPEPNPKGGSQLTPLTRKSPWPAWPALEGGVSQHKLENTIGDQQVSTMDFGVINDGSDAFNRIFDYYRDEETPFPSTTITSAHIVSLAMLMALGQKVGHFLEVDHHHALVPALLPVPPDLAQSLRAIVRSSTDDKLKLNLVRKLVTVFHLFGIDRRNIKNPQGDGGAVNSIATAVGTRLRPVVGLLARLAHPEIERIIQGPNQTLISALVDSRDPGSQRTKINNTKSVIRFRGFTTAFSRVYKEGFAVAISDSGDDGNERYRISIRTPLSRLVLTIVEHANQRTDQDQLSAVDRRFNSQLHKLVEELVKLNLVSQDKRGVYRPRYSKIRQLMVKAEAQALPDSELQSLRSIESGFQNYLRSSFNFYFESIMELLLSAVHAAETTPPREPER